jgi:ribosomal protection tetracycline resistance protein
MRTLNLGILAHVDAGKTTLTERLLYEAGVIDEVGSVDAGTTRTDSLPLEQQRGITITSAVVSFTIGEVAVNLIDTPGHPDFIAEVERALRVLDGAVLVVSAVEGVQPQTRILMRALQRLHVPTLIFVNKIDRRGARDEGVLHAITRRLTRAIIPMGTARRLGTPAADFAPAPDDDAVFASRLTEVLAEHDDAFLARVVAADTGVSSRRLLDELTAQTRRADVHPVFFGSALTGSGVDSLMSAIANLLPAQSGDPDLPLSAIVFKIDRGPDGEKNAYVRVFAGTVRRRAQIELGDGTRQRITAVQVFAPGGAVDRAHALAGEIAKLRGLTHIRVGDAIGRARPGGIDRQFAPPTLETIVLPHDPNDRARLRVALTQLAEQDPLINVRQNDALGELSASLYGEVQKEVIGSTLATDYGIDVSFRETTTIYVERPVGVGSALELLQSDENPFSATVGIRIEPAPPGSGLAVRIEVDPRTIPTHIYKTADSFGEHMKRYVVRSLEEGLFGWRVTDCALTLTDVGYYASDGPTKPSGRTTRTTAADFRKLTPLVVMRALQQAKTVVCEPMLRAGIETPSDTLGAVLALIARLGAVVEPASQQRELPVVDAVMPAARVRELHRLLPGLTGGEATFETTFAGYEPVTGPQPRRPRTTANPLNLDAYLMQLTRKGAHRSA